MSDSKIKFQKVNNAKDKIEAQKIFVNALFFKIPPTTRRARRIAKEIHAGLIKGFCNKDE